MNILKRNDIILLVAVLIVATVIFLIINLLSNDGSKVDVLVDNKIVASYPLNSDRIVNLNYKGQNKLVIEGGQAFITDADCPDKLCTKQRKVSKAGETIICLPHKTVVSVSGGERSTIDGVLD